MLTEVALCLTFPLGLQPHPFSVNHHSLDPVCPREAVNGWSMIMYISLFERQVVDIISNFDQALITKDFNNCSFQVFMEYFGAEHLLRGKIFTFTTLVFRRKLKYFQQHFSLDKQVINRFSIVEDYYLKAYNMCNYSIQCFLAHAQHST